MRRDSLWLHRDFRLLWASDTVSQFGTYVAHTVLPLLAVTALAAGPIEMGLLTAAETAAFLLIGLPAGVWIDRLRRHPIMVRTDVLRAALLLTVPVAWWAGMLTMEQLIVVALLAGFCTVFFDVSYMSYLPTLIERPKLMEGNAKLQASQSVAAVAGPALGGGMAQLVGAATAVLTTGLGYLASALFLFRIRTVEPAPQRQEERRMRGDVVEGLRFVFGNPAIRAVALCGSTAGFCFTMQQAVLVLFLTSTLGLSGGQVGVALAMAGIGGALGAVTSGWWTRRVGQARSIWLSALICTPFALLIPLAQPGWLTALVMIGPFVEGYGVTVHNVAQVSFRQSVCPDHLLGRMNASMRFMIWGAAPLGGLTGGMLGEWLGLRGALWVATAGLTTSVLWLLFSPLRTMRDIPASAVPDQTKGTTLRETPTS